MVVGFKHMWLAITSNLIAMLFVIVMMTVIKIWMFGAPKKERIIPEYSLHVMKNLPPDKPVVKYRNKPSNPYTHRIKPSYSQASKAKKAHQQQFPGQGLSGSQTPQYRFPGQPMNYAQPSHVAGQQSRYM